MAQAHVTVRDVEVPAVGLGTFRLQGRACTRVVRDALEMGYRHVDTAEFYDNHTHVGEGIRTSGVGRDEVFLTTKVWKTNLAFDDVLESTARSLEALGTTYVDLLLIHWPNERIPIEETMAALNRLQEEGRVRHVGVSNFSVKQLAEAIDASSHPLLTNQVKYNPYVDRSDLLAACADHDLLCTAYSPLEKGAVLTDDVLVEIGTRYGKTPAQVALRWLIQQDLVIAIPKASSRDHLEENLDVFDFELTASEMDRLFEHSRGLLATVRKLVGL